jgi:hypothetical protein
MDDDEIHIHPKGRDGKILTTLSELGLVMVPEVSIGNQVLEGTY